MACGSPLLLFLLPGCCKAAPQYAGPPGCRSLAHRSTCPSGTGTDCSDEQQQELQEQQESESGAASRPPSCV